MMRQISAVTFTALALFLFDIPSAQAQKADPAARSAAVALYDAAEQLSAAKNFAAACPKYAESYRLDPQLGALLHLADCLEKNGQFASAYGSFRESIELAENLKEDRLKIATERAKALEPRVNKLSIEVSLAARVPGLQVLRDGLPIAEGSWGIPIPVDPGEHVIEARAQGYLPYRTTLNINGEGRQEVTQIAALVAAPVATPVEPTKKTEDTDTGTNDPGSTQRLVGWVIGGAGVAAVGVGVALQIQKGNRISDRDSLCPSGINCEAGTQARIDQLTGDARSSQKYAIISFASGAIALGVGATLLITAPKSQTNRSARLQLAPLLGPNLAGLWATQTF